MMYPNFGSWPSIALFAAATLLYSTTPGLADNIVTEKGNWLSLKCSLNHSGSIDDDDVEVTWLDKNDNPLTNTTRPYIGSNTLRQDFQIPAFCFQSSVFYWRVTFGSKLQKEKKNVVCKVEVTSSQYAVRQAIVTPRGKLFHPGSILTCSAAGNPSPTYRWVELESGAVINGSHLQINTTDTVRYRCFATNTVRGQTFNAQSDVITFSQDSISHLASLKDSGCSQSQSMSILALALMFTFSMLVHLFCLIRWFCMRQRAAERVNYPRLIQREYQGPRMQPRGIPAQRRMIRDR